MENLIFSLDATMPVFLMMVFGYFLHRIGFVTDAFSTKLNQFVFKVALPLMLYEELACTDFVSAWDTKFVIFCFGATLLSILLVTFLSMPIRKKADRGEFVQSSYRSSAAILGIAYITNMYGNAGMAPLMILAAVPLYNVMAVVVLMVSAAAEQQDGKSSKEDAKAKRELLIKTLKGIATNPIILGILAGLLWSVLRLPMPYIWDTAVKRVGATTTPLGLIAMGASVDFGKVRGELKPAAAASFMKLIGLCAIFLPLAAMFGFRKEKLIAILIMLASPTTVSSYIMARNMGHEGTLSCNAVMFTTVISAFTLTFWIWIVKTLGLL